MRRIHFAVTDSTNSQARQLAAIHPGETLLITADEQSSGRGRQGRAWQSPRGGAWLSVVWPTSREPQAYASTSLVAAVAALRMVRDLAGSAFYPAQIKWPNDVLIDNRKVAGILCEQCLPIGGRGGLVIVGVGINVDFDIVQLGVGLRHEPTTLRAALGRPISVGDAIEAFALRFTEAMTEFESQGLSPTLRDALAANLAYVGAIRSWQTPRGTINGRVMGIDDAGRLLLEVDGKTTAHAVGEFAGDA